MLGKIIHMAIKVIDENETKTVQFTKLYAALHLLS